MLRPNNKVSQYDTVPFSSPHYSNYYVQEEADDGVVMESSVPAKDVRALYLFRSAFHSRFFFYYSSCYILLIVYTLFGWTCSFLIVAVLPIYSMHSSQLFSVLLLRSYIA